MYNLVTFDKKSRKKIRVLQNVKASLIQCHWKRSGELWTSCQLPAAHDPPTSVVVREEESK